MTYDPWDRHGVYLTTVRSLDSIPAYISQEILEEEATDAAAAESDLHGRSSSMDSYPDDDEKLERLYQFLQRAIPKVRLFDSAYF